MTSLPAMSLPGRLYSLDVMRGIAALSIVVFHWSHFFFRGTQHDSGIVVSEMPFYPILFALYLSGGLAVDLFFVLSGFVFYWLYSEKIANRSVGMWSFSVLRFSRLYPLHFATLLFVLLLQFLYRRETGSAFVYPHNDLYHFCLQLGFASEWGFQAGHSFNGPIWSVSVEILLYAIFFILCAAGKTGPWHAAVLCVGGLLVHKLNGAVGQGIFAFYIGGLTYFLTRFVLAKGGKINTIRFMLALCVVAWTGTVIGARWSLFARATTWLQEINLPVSDHVVTVLCRWAGEKLIVGGLFPLTILSLVLLEVHRGSGLGRRLAFLGDISYASYLLHFPLQLLIMTVFAWWGWSTNVFLHGWTLVVFYGVLIPLSIWVHHHFERPMQAYLRGRLFPERRTNN